MPRPRYSGITYKKTLKRLLKLLKDIDRNGYDGIGKPEQLSGDLAAYWSRRIDDFNRIVCFSLPGTTLSNERLHNVFSSGVKITMRFEGYLTLQYLPNDRFPISVFHFTDRAVHNLHLWRDMPDVRVINNGYI